MTSIKTIGFAQSNVGQCTTICWKYFPSPWINNKIKMSSGGAAYNLPCELFYKSFGKQVALRTKSYEDEAVWLDRVKRRRKWRQDCWHTLLDFFLTILKAPFWFCLRILFPVIMVAATMFMFLMFLFVSFIAFILICEFTATSCFEVNYGTTSIHEEQNDLDYYINYILTRYHEITHDFCRVPIVQKMVERRVREMYTKSNRNDDDEPGVWGLPNVPQHAPGQGPGVCLTGAPGGPRGV
jgi:hypothetical protein